MWEEGIKKMEIYSGRQQKKVAQYITTGPIMYLCLDAERYPGGRASK